MISDIAHISIKKEIHLDEQVFNISVRVSICLVHHKAVNLDRAEHHTAVSILSVCRGVKSELVFAELSDPSDSTGQRGSGDRFRSRPGGGGASC